MIAALLASILLGGAAGPSVIHRLDGSTISGSAVDAAVMRAMRLAKVPGAGIAIFNHRRLVYLKTYGLRDTARGLPMTPDSVMTAASLTKAAFAVMTMQLVHERVLSLDTPMYRYRRNRSGNSRGIAI